MAPTKRTGYTAVSMPTRVRDALQSTALAVSADVGKRISLAAVASAALTVARAHPDEFRKALTAPSEGDSK